MFEEYERLRQQASFGSGLQGLRSLANLHDPFYRQSQAILRVTSRAIPEEEYQRLKAIEENQVNTQEYENTILELEEIIRDQNTLLNLSNETIEHLNENVALLHEEIEELNDEFRILADSIY